MGCARGPRPPYSAVTPSVCKPLGQERPDAVASGVEQLKVATAQKPRTVPARFLVQHGLPMSRADRRLALLEECPLVGRVIAGKIRSLPIGQWAQIRTVLAQVSRPAYEIELRDRVKATAASLREADQSKLAAQFSEANYMVRRAERTTRQAEDMGPRPEPQICS